MNKSGKRIPVGIIGGSGLYDFPELKNVRKVKVATPFGRPSGPYITGTCADVDMVFLSRHGAGHRFNPSEVNYRANIYGMKKLGVERLISVSAVGSLKEEIPPGTIVMIDQFIDRTKSCRPQTFFEQGIVAHVSCADPICLDLREILCHGAKQAGVKVVKGGTYVCMEGPQFSSRAESHLYRSWGASVIGMTNLTEARLAREAQMCLATLAIATDYDCWRAGDEVDIDDLIRTLIRGTEQALAIIMASAAAAQKNPFACKCRQALKTAVFSTPKVISPAAKARTKLLFT
jgi:5'-methylthioadenosine phosphorylase